MSNPRRGPGPSQGCPSQMHHARFPMRLRSRLGGGELVQACRRNARHIRASTADRGVITAGAPGTSSASQCACSSPRLWFPSDYRFAARPRLLPGAWLCRVIGGACFCEVSCDYVPLGQSFNTKVSGQQCLRSETCKSPEQDHVPQTCSDRMSRPLLGLARGWFQTARTAIEASGAAPTT